MAEHSIGNFGYAASNKMVQVERDGTVRNSFTAIHLQLVCNRCIRHERHCYAHMIIRSDDL